MSLANCLLKHAKLLNGLDTSSIREAADEYVASGMSKIEAERKATDDKLAELAFDRARVEREILAQYKEMNPTAFALEAQSPAELQAKKDAEEKAAKEKAEEDRKAAEAESKAQERETVRQRSEGAAADFQLGQSAMDNLTGQKSMFSRTAADPETRSANFKAWSDNAPLVPAGKGMDYDFKTGQKVVVEAFHGTGRPDRVGNIFKRSRATSGPMAFFTNTPEIGAKYAEGKQDTSLSNEDNSYDGWFKFKAKGERSSRNIDRAWYAMTPEQREKISALAPRVMFDEEGDQVVLGPEGHDSGTGGYDNHINETKTSYNRNGNPLKALVEEWLSSGNLYNREEQFMDVLKLAGMPMQDVTYDSPHARYPFVFHGHVSMLKPLVTNNIPQDVVAALDAAAKSDRSRASPGYGADPWDKTTRTVKDWVAEFHGDSSEHVWTSIPDKVTAVFERMGYDGIIDVGGKNGGPKHVVLIPFQSSQFKALGNKGTYDRTSQNMMLSRRPTAPQESIPTTDARAATDVITKKWKNAPKITVHESLTSDSVPEGLRTAMEKEGVTDARGAWYAGGIELFPSNIGSLAELERTIVHEARHYGLEGLFGKDMNPILMEIYMKDKGVRTEANRLVKTLKVSTVDAVNETLANMPLDAAKKLPGWQKLIAKLKAWLNDHGFTNLAKMLEGPSADEITKDILFQIEDFVKTGKRGDTTFTTTLFHRAFHGSPHDHDGFSLDKIGTGEGAQAYGWGMYFAGSKEVADHYKKALSSKYPVSHSGVIEEDGKHSAWVKHTGDSSAKVIHTSDTKYGAQKALKEYLADKKGRLYEVELAPTQDQYLDWDKPLSEQSEKVKAALASDGYFAKGEWGTKTGQQIYDRIAKQKFDARAERSSGDGKRLASAHLKSIGIPGIRYLDGSSRSKGEGNHNFVIFDDKDVSIVAKYSRKPRENINSLLKKFGKPVKTILDAERAQSNGDRIFVFPEMDARPIEIKNVTELDGYDADQVLVVSRFANQPEAKYSRTAADQSAIFNHLRSASTAKEMTGRIASLLESDNTFNRLTKNINTQFHKAQLDKDFKRVFDAVQSQMSDTEHYAIEAEKLAPDVLIRMQGFSDIGRTILQGGKQYAADMKAIAQPLFANIEGKKGVKQFKYTDAELKSEWKLTDKQIALYHQYQAATAQSIDRLAQAKMLETAISLGMDVSGMKNLSLEDTHALLKSALFEAAEEKRNAALIKGIDEKASETLTKEAHTLYAIRDQLDKMNDNARELIVRGYTPAMRFGDFEVRGEVSDGKGKFTTEYMGRFESQAQANAMKIALQKEHPEWKVTKGKVNPNAYKMLKGVSPESFELMAQITGNADEDGVKQYIALAKSSRAAEKRLLERQGIAGFSEDASRVLAAFVTSNARATAQALNSTAINEALASKTLAAKGDVQAEAQNLVEYVSNPNEEAAKLRGLLFMHYMGGSIAAGIVNLTQPILQTAPHLSQYLSGVQTFNVMKAAAKAVATNKIPEKYKSLYQRAIDDGITEPHEIHQLMADAGGSTLGRSLRARAFVKAWGGFFSLSEAFNRKVTFLAAIQTAEQMGPAKIKEAGFKSAYEFAKDAIIQTQGLYNKGNRPNMARGAIGATIFTFKQFGISYIEWLSRLPRKQQLIALAMLILASGLEGLPFAEDIEDLIDTLGHRLGYATNSRKALRNAIASAVGKEAAEYVLHGSSRLTNIDLSGRLGMGNLIPGTAFFDPANKNKGKEILDVLGAAGGLGKGISGALDGDIAGTLPTALKNIAKAYQMADTGEYKDSKGRQVMKTDAWDAIVKAVGFQPTDVAEASKRTTDAMNDLEIIRYAKSEIADKWAQGIIEKKPEMVAEARRELTRWNIANQDMRVSIKPADIERRVKEARLTRDQRILKSAPAGAKASVMADLAQ